MNPTPSHLELLLAGYFHQDWREEASSPAEAVRNFVRREPPHVVRGADSELVALLSSAMTDGELRNLIVGGWGASYDPTLVGKSMRAWLTEIHGVLPTHERTI